MKTHKLVTKYTALIKSGLMTKSEINGMRKALGFCSKLKSEDKQTILDAMYDAKPIKITQEHSNQGIAYLLKTAFKSNGEKRNTKYFPFSAHDLNCLLKFKEFRLVSLDEVIGYGGNVQGYESVWRVYSKTKGDYFDYVCGHWGSVQVCNRGFKKGTL
jgi:hypothetical protein